MVFSIVPLPVMHVAELSWRDQPVIRAPALPVPISTVLFQLSSLNCAVQFLPRGKSCLIQERISASCSWLSAEQSVYPAARD